MIFDQRNCHHVYRIFRASDRETIYVGQTCVFQKSTINGSLKYVPNGYKGRWRAHVNSMKNPNTGCRKLINALNYYGVDAYVCWPLITCTAETVNMWEEFFIAEYNTLSPYGCNLKAGGAGSRLSEETKKLISESQMGKVIPQDQRLLISKTKKTDPNLPPYVIWCNDTERGYTGYKVNKHPVLPERCFTSNTLTMEQKLQQAKDYLDGKGDAIIKHGSYLHDDEWRKKKAASLAISKTLPVHIKVLNVSGQTGYVVRKPGLKIRQFSGKNMTSAEKLQKAIDYRDGRIPESCAQEPRRQAAKQDGLPPYIYLVNGINYGYKVEKCPDRANKTFYSVLMTMEEKLELAKEYIKGTLEIAERPLPTNVYRYENKGYKVMKTSKIPYKLFADPKLTKEENLQNAVAHVNMYTK